MHRSLSGITRLDTGDSREHKLSKYHKESYLCGDRVAIQNSVSLQAVSGDSLDCSGRSVGLAVKNGL